MLSTLAGIAIGFISMTFVLRIWSSPLIALAPLAIILITYFSDVRFPLGLPGGLVAVLVGTALGWVLPERLSGYAMTGSEVAEAWQTAGAFLPTWCGGEVLTIMQLPSSEWLGFFSIIIPMGLFNVIASLQNIESAEAAGDSYDTRSSLAVNGAGTIVAALLGSCFPTTIYIGHPGWKGLGARAGYSMLNGFVIALVCLTGTTALVAAVVPIEAGMAIVLWIGIIITAQAFQATPREHAPAVAIGLFPAIAGWGATIVLGTLAVAGGATVQSLVELNRTQEVSGFSLHGLIVMERGYIFTCMVLAACTARLIDRRFFAAAIWPAVGAVITWLGLMHAYQLSGNGVDYLLRGSQPAANVVSYRGHDIAIGYMVMAVVFVVVGLFAKNMSRPVSGVERTPNRDSE